MRLKELMLLLSRAELSNLKVVDKEEKCGIRKEDQDLVINLITEGLDKIYSRFYLKEDSIYLEVISGKVTYDITSKHLMDRTLEADYDHYLWKPGEIVFNDDILRILRIIDSTGVELPLNNPEKSNSVFTPLYNRIDISNLNKELELEIIYASKHPELSLETNPVIELPLSLIPAIRAYVAYVIHMNMNTENAVQNAQKYLQQYNLILAENIESGMPDTKYDDRACKFILGGWV